jgi:hypothetical protein
MGLRLKVGYAFLYATTRSRVEPPSVSETGAVRTVNSTDRPDLSAAEQTPNVRSLEVIQPGSIQRTGDE